jgi:hypothetical protein
MAGLAVFFDFDLGDRNLACPTGTAPSNFPGIVILLGQQVLPVSI